jgi:hypothetical protein
MRFLEDYDRRAAVLYAHEWAFGRNPQFYNYDSIGGDCTNFASQCLYTGTGIMNFTPDFGWYYIDADQKAPAWTGVPYLHQFLTRKEPSVGPLGREVPIGEMVPGDLVQLRFQGQVFQHTPIVVRADNPQSPSDLLLAAHSYDADNRPLSTYTYEAVRYLHILGTIRP